MDYSRYEGMQRPTKSDVLRYSDEMNEHIGKMADARKVLHDKYIQEAPFKVGDQFVITHRKHGKMRAKLSKIRVNTLDGSYEYTFKLGNGKKLTGAHVIDAVRTK